MFLLFFEKIVEDAKTGTPTEDLVAFLKKSYKEALEPYHGWMAQQLFDVSYFDLLIKHYYNVIGSPHIYLMDQI